MANEGGRKEFFWSDEIKDIDAAINHIRSTA